MQYHGFYINLDQNVTRRAHVENQLAACELQPFYTRFPACSGTTLNVKAPGVSPGNIGCFSSHYLLLKSQVNSPTHLHVVEDDVVFSPHIAKFIDSLATDGVLEAWDMLYTDIFVPIDFNTLKDLSLRFRRCTTLDEDGTISKVENFAVLPLKDRIFASTASYIVNKNSVGKLANLLEEAVKSEIPRPIDLFYRKHTYEGRITAACLFPFITSIDQGLSQASNISPTSQNTLEISLLATTLLRNLFFLHSKPRDLLAACASHLNCGPMDDRDKVLASICRFALSPSYRSF